MKAPVATVAARATPAKTARSLADDGSNWRCSLWFMTDSETRLNTAPLCAAPDPAVL